MVFKMKVSSIHLKGKVESGLKWGDLAMKITAGVRHSNLEKYSGAGTNTAEFSCSNCHWRTIEKWQKNIYQLGLRFTLQTDIGYAMCLACTKPPEMPRL